MISIESVTLDVPDAATAEAFYTSVFGLGGTVRLRASNAPTTGFRGFTLSAVVSQPATVNRVVGAALDAGATALKPVAKSFWGYGGVVHTPDGTIWKVATSAKKDTGPAARHIDEVVLLLGVADVAASKRFYLDRGLAVARSFGRKYVEFAASSSALELALYGRRALAKDAGRQRLSPAHDPQRCRTVHRPRWIGVGGRIEAASGRPALERIDLTGGLTTD